MANFRKFGKSDENLSSSRNDSNSKDSNSGSSKRNSDGRSSERSKSSGFSNRNSSGPSDRSREQRPSGDSRDYKSRPSTGRGGYDKPREDRSNTGRGGFEKRDDRPASGRGGYDRPREDRPSSGRGGYDRPREDRPASGRGGFDRPREDRPSSGRGGFDRPKEDRPASGRGGFDRPREDRPASGRGGFDRPREDRPASGRGGYDRPREDRPAGRGGEDKPISREDRFYRRPPAGKGLTEKSGFEKEERPRKGKPSLKRFQPNTDHQVGPERAPRYDQNALKAKASARVKEKIEQDTYSPDEEIRLNKYISNSGLCSRREADELIESGMIKVNGEVVAEMGYKVKDSDTVKYGKDVLNRERMMYVLLNKPKDFLTTMDDPKERKTVMDLVSGACKERIYPVGRLDRNTTGLLLLTNDGELTVKLTHPSNDIKKIYQAELDKPITDEHFEMIKNGLELEDGEIKPDQLAIVSQDAHVVGIEIHSGKNRIVRRIFEHLGYEVTKLDRTTYAGLTKKDLPRGKWRFLSEKELIRLKYML